MKNVSNLINVLDFYSEWQSIQPVNSMNSGKIKNNTKDILGKQTVDIGLWHRNLSQAKIIFSKQTADSLV